MFGKRYFLLAATAVILAAAVASARAQNNGKEILALEPAKLIEILKDPAAGVFEKAKACQRLAVVGDRDAIAPLAALLSDETLNLYARFGLEGIPGPAVDAALRDATGKLHGRQLVGVIDSIGQRKDTQATDLLKGLLASGDGAVVSAAAGALGRIGTSEAAAILKDALGKDSAVKSWIADGCLAAAERLASGGRQAEAAALYEAVAKAELPKPVKIAALYGKFRLQPDKSLVLIQLHSADKAMFNLGLRMAREMPGAETSTWLAAELPSLPAGRQAALLLALGDRNDRVALPVVLAASKSPSLVLRVAALRVLGQLGDPAALAILLEAALGDDEAVEVAKDGLKTLPGQEVDAAVTARLSAADAKAKITLFEVAGARRTVAAEPLVRAALADADPAVRAAAMTAMGQLIELKDLQFLIGRALAGATAEEATAAQNALKIAALRMADREGCAAKLAEALKGATGANQAYLFDLLVKVSGPKALETVVVAARAQDLDTKEAATRALGEWVNADAAPALLEMAKSETDAKYQIRALRGYIRIARQLQLPDPARLAMFRTAMTVATRPDEKRLTLDILTRIPSPETLGVATEYLGNSVLRKAAADAAVKIAVKQLNVAPKAVAAAMQKVVDAGVAGPLGAHAKQLLEQANAAAK
jgi:HEAT repeat protein